MSDLVVQLAAAAVTGLVAGVISAAAILIAVKIDMRWVKVTLGELRDDIRYVHQRVDVLVDGRRPAAPPPDYPPREDP